MLYAEHHESHAASAFFPSPFEEAAILTIDGVGEWATASIGVGRGNDIEILDELHWPDSLGLLYSAFTYYTGFKVNSGEYKVMGLAPYGEPKYVDLIYKELIDLREDGSFRLNQKYFNYLTGLTMTNGEFDKLFGGPPREPETKLTQREMDLARSVQVVCEEIMLRMARTAHQKTGLDNLCLAGGVALNCVGNGRLLREGPFKQHLDSAGGGRRRRRARRRAAHRPPPLQAAARRRRQDRRDEGLVPRARSSRRRRSRRSCKASGAPAERLDGACLSERVAQRCSPTRRSSAGSTAAWSSARARSAPAASSAIRAARGCRRDMNIKIKFREGFRPFAPACCASACRDYFELDTDSPVHAAGRAGAQGAAHPADRRSAHALGHRQAQRAALRHSGRHAHRLLGARPDRDARHQPRATTT